MDRWTASVDTAGPVLDLLNACSPTCSPLLCLPFPISPLSPVPTRNSPPHEQNSPQLPLSPHSPSLHPPGQGRMVGHFDCRAVMHFRTWGGNSGGVWGERTIVLPLPSSLQQLSASPLSQMILEMILELVARAFSAAPSPPFPPLGNLFGKGQAAPGRGTDLGWGILWTGEG